MARQISYQELFQNMQTASLPLLCSLKALRSLHRLWAATLS
jgi:hypothetical protein